VEEAKSKAKCSPITIALWLPVSARIAWRGSVGIDGPSPLGKVRNSAQRPRENSRHRDDVAPPICIQ
jgi:hypothetical protein